MSNIDSIVRINNILSGGIIQNLIIFCLSNIEIPSKISAMQERVYLRALLFAFATCCLALFISFVAIAAGCFLIYQGVSGNITWIAEAGTSKSQLYNASPGLVVVIAGLALPLFVKFKVQTILANA
jgi:hypothetical protein